MAEKLSTFKRMTRAGETLTLRSALKPAQSEQIDALAAAIAEAIQ